MQKYLYGCFIQFDSDTSITHATRVTTLWLKHFFSVWVCACYAIVHIMYMARVSLVPVVQSC